MKTIIFAFVLFSISSTGYAQYHNLSNDSGNSSQPEVVVDDNGNVHVA